MALRWRSSSSCNIKEIDNQHKKLFEISSMLNILEPVCAEGDYNEEILEVIGKLKDYAVFHFDYEEKLMAQYGYSGFAEHQAVHATFLREVLRLETEHQDFSKPKTVRSIAEFIDTWITNHIMKTDMKYKDFLNGQGIF